MFVCQLVEKRLKKNCNHPSVARRFAKAITNSKCYESMLWTDVSCIMELSATLCK